jgi:hypothetical protein
VRITRIVCPVQRGSELFHEEQAALRSVHGLPVHETRHGQYPGWIHAGAVITNDAGRFEQERDLMFLRFGEGGATILRKHGPARASQSIWMKSPRGGQRNEGITMTYAMRYTTEKLNAHPGAVGCTYELNEENHPASPWNGAPPELVAKGGTLYEARPDAPAEWITARYLGTYGDSSAYLYCSQDPVAVAAREAEKGLTVSDVAEIDRDALGPATHEELDAWMAKQITVTILGQDDGSLAAGAAHDMPGSRKDGMAPPFKNDGPYDSLTAPQYQRTLALALAHRHAWALATQPPPVSWDEPFDVEAALDGDRDELLRHRDGLREMQEHLRREVAQGSVTLMTLHFLTDIDAYFNAGREQGITKPVLDQRGEVIHTTSTGRLRWQVSRDGTVRLEVTRPHPDRAVLDGNDPAARAAVLERHAGLMAHARAVGAEQRRELQKRLAAAVQAEQDAGGASSSTDAAHWARGEQHRVRVSLAAWEQAWSPDRNPDTGDAPDVAAVREHLLAHPVVVMRAVVEPRNTADAGIVEAIHGPGGAERRHAEALAIALKAIGPEFAGVAAVFVDAAPPDTKPGAARE